MIEKLLTTFDTQSIPFAFMLAALIALITSALVAVIVNLWIEPKLQRHIDDLTDKERDAAEQLTNSNDKV